jgi:hypothetical protein
MPGPIIVSSVAICLPVAGALWLAPKRDGGRFKGFFRPICARPYELMAMLHADMRVL